MEERDCGLDYLSKKKFRDYLVYNLVKLCFGNGSQFCLLPSIVPPFLSHAEECVHALNPRYLHTDSFSLPDNIPQYDLEFEGLSSRPVIPH